MKTSEIIHDVNRQQFRMIVDQKHTALVDYDKRGKILYLTHSEVPHQLRGMGIGKILVEKVYAYLENNKLEAVPICSFIRKVAERRARNNNTTN